MEIKSKIFKRKAGKSAGKWTLRISYLDPGDGRMRTRELTKARRVEVVDERDRLVKEISSSHGGFAEGERMTFQQLAEKCADLFYGEAVIVEGRKIEGVRSRATAQNNLAVLNEFFGKRRINQITSENLSDYRSWRLKIGSRRPEVQKSGVFSPIKLATINGELSTMRRVMRFALAKGWISRDIFFGSRVIDRSAEVERVRILTGAEERRLLDACHGERVVSYKRKHYGSTRIVKAVVSVDNPHLKAIILIAIDSGLRKGEILKLKWSDLDLSNGIIRVQGTHTKTMRDRVAPLTDRTVTELQGLRQISSGDVIFPFSDFKRSWATAKRVAEIEDLHFHDLRRTALTRWQHAGLPIALAGKMAGHTNLQTTMKHYTANDQSTVSDFAQRLNSLHQRPKDITEGDFSIH